MDVDAVDDRVRHCARAALRLRSTDLQLESHDSVITDREDVGGCAGAVRRTRTADANSPSIECLHVRNPTSQVVSMAVVVATGIHRQRRPGDPGLRHRRLRGRDVLARVPAVTAHMVATLFMGQITDPTNETR